MESSNTGIRREPQSDANAPNIDVGSSTDSRQTRRRRAPNKQPRPRRMDVRFVFGPNSVLPKPEGVQPPPLEPAFSTTSLEEWSIAKSSYSEKTQDLPSEMFSVFSAATGPAHIVTPRPAFPLYTPPQALERTLQLHSISRSDVEAASRESSQTVEAPRASGLLSSPSFIDSRHMSNNNAPLASLTSTNREGADSSALGSTQASADVFRNTLSPMARRDSSSAVNDIIFQQPIVAEGDTLAALSEVLEILQRNTQNVAGGGVSPSLFPLHDLIHTPPNTPRPSTGQLRSRTSLSPQKTPPVQAMSDSNPPTPQDSAMPTVSLPDLTTFVQQLQQAQATQTNISPFLSGHLPTVPSIPLHPNFNQIFQSQALTSSGYYQPLVPNFSMPWPVPSYQHNQNVPLYFPSMPPLPSHTVQPLQPLHQFAHYPGPWQMGMPPLQPVHNTIVPQQHLPPFVAPQYVNHPYGPIPVVPYSSQTPPNIPGQTSLTSQPPFPPIMDLALQDDIWTKTFEYAQRMRRQNATAQRNSKKNQVTSDADVATLQDTFCCPFCARLFRKGNSFALHLKAHRQTAYNSMREIMQTGDDAIPTALQVASGPTTRNEVRRPLSAGVQKSSSRRRASKRKARPLGHLHSTIPIGSVPVPYNDTPGEPEGLASAGPITPLGTPPRSSSVGTEMLWHQTPARNRTSTASSSHWREELFGFDDD
ncbi:unnamed protein product [Somion occarium]|uniref:C2H2-type domain-containing protein n=1 Tax=Somion occarium TaxID=3059160 RepID=A0ABP1CXI0_9APHY